MASALDFFGLRRAPVAHSNNLIALRMVVNSVGLVTETFKSSAYATIVTLRASYPIVSPLACVGVVEVRVRVVPYLRSKSA